MTLLIELNLSTALANGQEAADTLLRVAEDLPRTMSEGWVGKVLAIRDRNTGDELGFWSIVGETRRIDNDPNHPWEREDGDRSAGCRHCDRSFGAHR